MVFRCEAAPLRTFWRQTVRFYLNSRQSFVKGSERFNNTQVGVDGQEKTDDVRMTPKQPEPTV